MNRMLTGITLAAALVAVSLASGNAQGWYGHRYNLPSGSYQESCVNTTMSGSTLSAYCTNPSGQRIYSSLNVASCTGNTDIANVNGYLTCNGSGWYTNVGYRGQWNSGLPAGSYTQSCTNARIVGQVLMADCTNNSGNYIGSSLNLSRCGPGSDVGNVDGRLRCVYNH